jgi:thiol-disulfide isomerase/thioredoxin
MMTMRHLRRIGKLAAAAILAAGICLSLAARGASDAPSADTILSFDGNTGWVNSPPLTLSDLHGKVVLVDFWEYTCINCLRTLPYLRAWYDRYHDDGFVIIGVHTPEFGFSGETGNVQAAVKQLGISWPVALDSKTTIAHRYQMWGWPEEFLYDQNGQLVETQKGEGNYPQTEAKIQSLLRATNPNAHFPAVMALLPQDSYDKPGAVCYPQTPETFVGPWHGQSIANASALQGTGDANYIDSPTATHQDGAVYLSGYWHISPDGEAMVSGGSDGYLSLLYQAIQVEVVMKPENGGSVRVNVTEDGKPVPREDAGSDLQFDSNGNSYVMVDASRAYDVIMNKQFGKHSLHLAPDHYGLGIYDIAFESCEVPTT